jgi:hypothetical protein
VEQIHSAVWMWSKVVFGWSRPSGPAKSGQRNWGFSPLRAKAQVSVDPLMQGQRPCSTQALHHSVSYCTAKLVLAPMVALLPVEAVDVVTE